MTYIFLSLLVLLIINWVYTQIIKPKREKKKKKDLENKKMHTQTVTAHSHTSLSSSVSSSSESSPSSSTEQKEKIIVKAPAKLPPIKAEPTTEEIRKDRYLHNNE